MTSERVILKFQKSAVFQATVGGPWSESFDNLKCGGFVVALKEFRQIWLAKSKVLL